MPPQDLPSKVARKIRKHCIKRIKKYYEEYSEIAQDGYVTLELVTLIVDMLQIFGRPTRTELMEIFDNEYQVNTICNLFDIMRDSQRSTTYTAYPPGE